MGHTSAVSSLELISTNNKIYLASGSSDKTMKLWDLENYCLLKTFKVPSEVQSLTTLNIKNVPYLFSGHRNGSIIVWSENIFRQILKLQRKSKDRPSLPEAV